SKDRVMQWLARSRIGHDIFRLQTFHFAESVYQLQSQVEVVASAFGNQAGDRRACSGAWTKRGFIGVDTDCICGNFFCGPATWCVGQMSFSEDGNGGGNGSGCRIAKE